MHVMYSVPTPPPPTRRRTDACENITVLELRLRAVKIKYLHKLVHPDQRLEIKLARMKINWLLEINIDIFPQF